MHLLPPRFLTGNHLLYSYHRRGRGGRPALCAQGVCHFELGQHEKALQHFTTALELDPKHAPSCSNRANCLRNLGKADEAERDYSRAIDLDKTNPKAYLSRALLRESRQQVSPALDDYRRVIELAPQHELALRKLLSLTPDLTSGAAYSGALYKRGHLNPSYQKRFFVLHGAMVCYFESEETARQGADRAKGSPIVASLAHVRPSQVAELSAEKAARAFRFESTEGKHFIVYSETPEHKNGWLNALAKAVGGGHGKKRLTAEEAFASQILASEAATGQAGQSSDGGAPDAGSRADESEGGGVAGDDCVGGSGRCQGRTSSSTDRRGADDPGDSAQVLAGCGGLSCLDACADRLPQCHVHIRRTRTRIDNLERRPGTVDGRPRLATPRRH